MTSEYPEHLKRYFEELSEKGIKLSPAQKNWYYKKSEMLDSSMKKEYPSTPDEAFETNIDGLYYATHISILRAQKRVQHIPIDPTLKVHTAWDLGFHDATTVIFFQINGREIHAIDFIEETGTSLAECIKLVYKKGHIYGTHLAPHDIRVHELSSGVSRIDTAAKLGIHYTLVPDLSLSDGIDAVRNAFNRLYFNNSDSVIQLVGHIENYSQRWDRGLGQWSGRPEHDKHSHAADALRYLIIGLSYCQDEAQSVTQSEADNLWRTHGKKL